MAPVRTAVVATALPIAVLLVLLLADVRGTAQLAAPTLVVALGAAVLFECRTRDLAQLSRRLTDRAHTSMSGRVAGLQAEVEAERALVQRLPDPLVIVGHGRTVLRTNRAADTTFGDSLSAVMRHPALRGAMDRALTENRPQKADIRLPVPVEREVSATVIPLDPPLGTGARLVAVLADRTRERGVERMRADFVANASHELRTPLASLIGFIDTLRGPALGDAPAQERFLGIMAEQAGRMNRLIDDLLSLSHIELTEHQRPSGTVDLVALVHRVASVFEPRVAAGAVTLTLAIAPDLPAIEGDEDQLEQVLQNLLENAVKYGRDGGTIRVAAMRTCPGPPWPHAAGVMLAVSDEGAGIPRRHIPRLTERFYRADTHRSRAMGGTGLGLAIVKHIVNRHRGRLLIDSTEGVGTVVTVWLPSGAASGGAAPGSGATGEA